MFGGFSRCNFSIMCFPVYLIDVIEWKHTVFGKVLLEKKWGNFDMSCRKERQLFLAFQNPSYKLDVKWGQTPHESLCIPKALLKQQDFWTQDDSQGHTELRAPATQARTHYKTFTFHFCCHSYKLADCSILTHMSLCIFLSSTKNESSVLMVIYKESE